MRGERGVSEGKRGVRVGSGSGLLGVWVCGRCVGHGVGVWQWAQGVGVGRWVCGRGRGRWVCSAIKLYCSACPHI